MRLIDADELIKAIDYSADMGGALGKVIEVVKLYAKFMAQTTPTIEPQKWTPCSERLPEGMNTVLVTCVREVKHKHKKKNISVKFAWCCPFWEEIGAEKAWTICGINQNDADKFKVVAWMPLPKPYKGEE